MGRTRVRVGAATDVGRTRSHNEDSFGLRLPDDCEVADRKGLLLVVCDGMGGHAAGEVASQIAVETILTTYYDTPLDDPADALVEAIQLANTRIFEQASQRPDQRGMGTTCVAVVIRGDELTVAHAGDSRAYLVRNGVLTRLTRDHSLVEEWVTRGVLPAEQADQHPMANVITRALGHAPKVQVETRREPAQAGDIIMLCSDGLSGKVREDRLRDVLVALEDPDETVAQLIALANEAGGPDNISVIIARVEEVAPVVVAGLNGRTREQSPAATQPLHQAGGLDATRPVPPTATLPAIRALDEGERSEERPAGSTLFVAEGRLQRGCYVAAAAALIALMVIALIVAGALVGWVPGLRLVGWVALLPLLVAALV